MDFCKCLPPLAINDIMSETGEGKSRSLCTERMAAKYCGNIFAATLPSSNNHPKYCSTVTSVAGSGVMSCWKQKSANFLNLEKYPL